MHTKIGEDRAEMWLSGKVLPFMSEVLGWIPNTEKKKKKVGEELDQT
jgi:hypothetical protein